jgi:hypothetical protein
VREAAEGYVTILNGCCRFLRKQNRTRTSRKEGMKKERETVKRKENERERERERESKKAVRGKNYAVLQYSRVRCILSQLCNLC